jgi:hypothetical protein
LLPSDVNCAIPLTVVSGLVPVSVADALADLLLLVQAVNRLLKMIRTMLIPLLILFIVTIFKINNQNALPAFDRYFFRGEESAAGGLNHVFQTLDHSLLFVIRF